MTSALFPFAGSFLQQAFECSALHINIHSGPLLFVDHRDDPLEVDRVVEARRGLSKHITKEATCFTKLSQDVRIMVGQRRARLRLETFPSAAFGNGSITLLCHFQEQQIRELLDVIAVINAVMAEGVAKAPEFLNDVGHG